MNVKALLLGAALAAACTAPASAAVTFQGSATVTQLHTADPGLVLYANPINFGPVTLDTNGATPTPQSFSANILTIGTTEDSVTWFEDTDSFDIALAFSFVSPTGVATGTEVTGTTRGTFFGDLGVVKWDGPVVFNFGDGGAFKLTLDDVAFGTPGSATVKGTFKLLSESRPAVPETATWAMMIAGMGVVGASMRRRKVAVSFA